MFRILIFVLCFLIAVPAWAKKVTVDEKGNTVTQYDNGTMFVEKENGTEITINPDGSRLIEREDGSIEQWTTLDDGWERIIYDPDGNKTIEERPKGWREDLPYDYEGPEYEVSSWRGEAYPIYLDLNMQMNNQKEWDSDPDENHVDPLNPDEKSEHDAKKEEEEKQKKKQAALDLFIDEKFIEAEQKGLVTFNDNVNDEDTSNDDHVNNLYIEFVNEWYGIHGYENEDDYLDHKLRIYDATHGFGLVTAEEGERQDIERDKFIEETKNEWEIGQNLNNAPILFGNPIPDIPLIEFDVDERTSGRDTSGIDTGAQETLPQYWVTGTEMPLIVKTEMLNEHDQSRNETHTDPPKITPRTSGTADLLAGTAALEVKESSTVTPITPPQIQGNHIDWGNGFSTSFTPNGQTTEGQDGSKIETNNGKTQCQDANGYQTYNTVVSGYNQPLVDFIDASQFNNNFNAITPSAGGNGVFTNGAPTVDILVNDRIAQVVDGVAPFFFSIDEFLGTYNINNKTGFLNQPGFTTLTITLENADTGEVRFTPNDPVVPPVIGGVNLEQGVFGARVPNPPPNVEIRNGAFTKLPGGGLQFGGLYDNADTMQQGNIAAQK